MSKRPPSFILVPCAQINFGGNAVYQASTLCSFFLIASSSHKFQWPEVRPLSDWRIESAKWTRGAVLQFKRYTLYREGWDHDHCECCWAKFAESGGPDVLTEGYATEDNYRWICPTCFHELKDVMGWKLA